MRLAREFVAGLSMAELATQYGLSVEKVEQAIRLVLIATDQRRSR